MEGRIHRVAIKRLAVEKWKQLARAAPPIVAHAVDADLKFLISAAS
jgi:hypothetical protein